MFRQIFGSKLQHPDAEQRLQAIAELETDDPRLQEVAVSDEDAPVRRAALAKLTSLDTLGRAVDTEQDAQTRTAALKRLADVLCAESESEQLSESQESALARLRAEEGALERVLTQARSTAVRGAALEHVASQPVLAKVAATDPAGQLRTTALVRVVEESLLEEIARAARNRDKGVARLARERADAARLARERAEEADRLCLEIERLASSALDAVDTAAYQKLDQEWEQWESADTEDFASARERYARARERIQKRLTGRAEARRRAAGILQALADAVHAPQAGQHLDLDALRAEWSGLAENAGGEHDTQTFAAAAARLEAARKRWATDRARASELDAWLTAREGAVQASPKDDDLAATWNAMAKPEDKALAEPLSARFEALRSTVDSGTPVAAPTVGADKTADPAPCAQSGKGQLTEAQVAERLEQLAKRLDEADARIAGGELKPATAAFDAARALSEQLGKAKGNSTIRAARERLASTGPKLNELRSWRRWSTDRARERLCDEVEQLLASEQAPAERARTIRAYRESWKKLDKAEGGAAKALWERFNTACTKAYEPCRKHFAAEADQRNENLTRKVALVEGLEQLAANTDWDGEVDWRALDKAVGQFRREWRAIGAVNRRDNKALMERHDKACAAFDERLIPIREQELDRRRSVVAQLTALSEQDDLRGAADQAKRAQAEWTPAVRGPRKVEQALWTDFRAACDRIFERLREQREHAQGARDDALKLCQQACERIEALSAELASLGFRAEDRAREDELVKSLRDARGAYADAGELPRAKEAAVKARYRKACDSFDAARRQRREARQLRGLAALAERAALASLLEQASLRSAPDLTEQAQRINDQWQALEATQDKGLEAVCDRYERALKAAQGDEQALSRLTHSIASNLEQREQLCLELELATGVDSPAHLKAQRMAMQIDRLQASMSGTDTPSGSQIEGLLRQWYALGPVGDDDNNAFEERFARISAAALGAKRR